MMDYGLDVFHQWPNKGIAEVKKSLAATYSPTLLCAVPSAMKGLTSEFGMGSGISLSLLPPSKNLVNLVDLISYSLIKNNA